MNLFYNAGIAAYSAAVHLAAVRSPKAAHMTEGQRSSLARLEKEGAEVAPEGYDLWLHAASLGEFEQGRPLLERVRREHPEAHILLSFFSPSGYEVRKDCPLADTVVYLPFDRPRLVRRFLDAARPRCAVFVKYEFWGNFITELHRRKVPVYLISAIFRPSQIFFRPWGGTFRRILRCYTKIFVQDENSKRLLESVGADKVVVAGDTRFDRVSEIMHNAKDLPEIKEFCGNSEFTLVAGSSWPPDEDVYIDWLHAHPGAKAICAPHEFDGRRLEALLRRFGEGAILYSELKKGAVTAADVRYIIVDCFGLLSSLYRYGDAALIGGGFGVGIHNLNEAAVYGIPVVFGPNHSKFKEAGDLIECRGGMCMHDAGEGRAILTRLYDDPAMRRACGAKAGKYIKDNIGATDLIYEEISQNILRHD